MTLALLVLSSSGCVDYGVSRKSHSDAFAQAERPNGVDILWLQDDSGSMDEERDLLAADAHVLINFIFLGSVDFRLGVASTDMDVDTAGTLTGPAIDPYSDEPLETFLDQVDFDLPGSIDERGLEAAIAAADPLGVNEDFGRATADLEVVAFSDEDDHSELDVSQVLEALQEDRPGVRVGVSAIVGDPPEGCVSPYAAADPGLRYIEAAESTEGMRESICSPDYDGVLQRIALNALGLTTHFALTAVPDLSTLAVYVDEVRVHERREDGWHYDVGENSIVFDGLAIPPPGSAVYVTYLEWYGVQQEQEPEDSGDAGDSGL